MSQLLDLFEKDSITDILALTNIGKRISGNKDILIQFINSTEAVFTDCRFIYLPSKYKADIKSAQGLVAHESGHIGYGSFEVAFVKLVKTLSEKYNMPLQFVKNVVNVIEDVRINIINNKKFPGFYRNLRILTNKMLPKLTLRVENAKNILLYINLFLEDYEGFLLKPKLKDFEITNGDWDAISKVKDFLFKSQTPSTSIIACDVLCKILKKNFKVEEMNRVKEINSLRGTNNNTISHIQKISKDKKKSDKTQLDKTSEELIDKLKEIDIEPEDLAKLVENPKDINKKSKDQGKKKKKKNKQNKSKKKKEKSKNGEKEKTKNIDTPETKPSLFEGDHKKINLENLDLDINKKKHKKLVLKQITEILKDAEKVMEERLILLENCEYMVNPIKRGPTRKVKDTTIEKEIMKPDGMPYTQIKAKYRNVIKRMRIILEDLKNKSGIDPFQKKGRLNNKFIKAVTSDYKFKQCFTRKLLKKELKLLVLVDISGSMTGIKIKAAKIALVILCEALEGLAKIKIVLFTGKYDALNILVKNFDEFLKPHKIDKFGCHSKEGQNIDGVSIKHEANKLEKDDIIIVISDGQPAANGGYNLNDAIPDIHYVRKKFKIFAFSIDSQGDYLNKMYGKDWVLTSSKNQAELGKKMIKFCQIITNEFFR